MFGVMPDRMFHGTLFSRDPRGLFAFRSPSWHFPVPQAVHGYRGRNWHLFDPFIHGVQRSWQVSEWVARFVLGPDLAAPCSKEDPLAPESSKEAVAARAVALHCQDKDILVILGNTKAGKSAITNLLAGNPLTAVLNRAQRYTLIRADDTNPGPVIGDKRGVSETSLPSVWKVGEPFSSQIPQLVVDLPGFNDSQGRLQDDANAFYMDQILRGARSFKIVIVSDVGDITGDNPSRFMDLVRRIEATFSQSSEIMRSASIVFSKCEKNEDLEVIQACLQDVLASYPMMPGAALLQHLVDHPSSIGVFQRPVKAGPLEKDVAEDLVSVISRAAAVRFSAQEICPEVPAEKGVASRS